tara:strand:- start:626 stop:1579 length:954 start_codon:yes stop_codon:yes gene_type:complete
MTITTRAGKGAALTHAELDANFTDLGLAHGDTAINVSVDGVAVTGNVASKTTTIGDFTVTSNNYATHGLQIEGGDQSWAGVILKENSGSTGKPVQNLSNPSFSSVISGGTVASPTALESGKRLLSVYGMGTLDAAGTTPLHSQASILWSTTEAQTTSTCGAKLTFETSPNGRAETTTRTKTLELQDNVVTVNPDGNGVLKSGGILTLDDAVVVEETLNVKGNVDCDADVNVDGGLTVDGNVILCDANTDTITTNGKIISLSGFTMTVIDSATAGYLLSVSAAAKGDLALISDGSRADVPIYCDGSAWRYMSDSATIS